MRFVMKMYVRTKTASTNSSVYLFTRAHECVNWTEHTLQLHTHTHRLKLYVLFIHLNRVKSIDNFSHWMRTKRCEQEKKHREIHEPCAFSRTFKNWVASRIVDSKTYLQLKLFEHWLFVGIKCCCFSTTLCALLGWSKKRVCVKNLKTKSLKWKYHKR